MEGGGQGDVIRVRAPPAQRNMRELGDTVPPSPLCCEFHQNGAIIGGEEEGERKKRENFMSDCDIVIV